MAGVGEAAGRIREIRLATFGSSEEPEMTSAHRDSEAKPLTDDLTPTIPDADPEMGEAASELLASQGHLIGVLLDRIRALEQRVAELERTLPSKT